MSTQSREMILNRRSQGIIQQLDALNFDPSRPYSKDRIDQLVLETICALLEDVATIEKDGFTFCLLESTDDGVTPLPFYICLTSEGNLFISNIQTEDTQLQTNILENPSLDNVVIKRIVDLISKDFIGFVPVTNEVTQAILGLVDYQ